MNNISTEAKNEVRELLGDLVVYPVTSDVKKTISDIEKLLSTYSGEQNKEIIRLKSLITLEKNNITKEIANKLDDVSGNIGGLEKTSKLIKSKTESLDTKLSEVKENSLKTVVKINDIEPLIGKVNDSLSDAISAHFENFSQRLADEKNMIENINYKLDDSKKRIENLCHSTYSDISKAIEICQSETIDRINNSANIIKTDVKSISSDLQKLNSNVILLKSELAAIDNFIIPSFDQVIKNQNTIGEQLENKSEDVSNNVSELMKVINCGNESLREQGNIVMESVMHINKQNTRLFYVTLVLSIINSIGLFSMLYILINSLV